MGAPPHTLAGVSASRRVRGASTALWAVLAAGCGADPAPAPAPPPAGVPGVVLVCLDTLRADAVGAMPALAAFAHGATTFSGASASSAWTAPSVTTLLTGLDPVHSGVRGQTPGALVPGVTTLAETLAAAGWSTAAVTAGGWVSPERGLAQGFASFQLGFDVKTPEAIVSGWSAARPKDRSFFLFLHSYLPHDPYGPKDESPHRVRVPPQVVAEAEAAVKQADAAGGRLPAPAALRILEVFLTDGPARFAIVGALGPDRADALWRQILERIDGDLAGTPGLLAVADRARAAYVAGLAHADALVARLLAALAAANLPPGTALIVVGDHGEEFGEHGSVLHARRLYDELVRVPLVVSAPGRLPAGAVVAGSCSLADVTPTILDLARLAPAGPLDGVSLLPLAAAKAAGRPIVGEEERAVPLAGGGERRLRVLSVRTEDAKYVLTVDEKTQEPQSEEFYDLRADPAERRSLPLDGLDRPGPDFCRAVAAARARVPGFTTKTPCAK